MNNSDIIDTFLATFSRYIDSGFGLLGGEVSWLSATLIGIDLTLAGLFWAWGADEDVVKHLVRKILTIGTFAYIIGNFQNLATILFNSFAGLGLKAVGDPMTIADFLRPGKIGDTGIDVALQLLNNTTGMLGPIATLTDFPQVLMLLLGAVLIMLAFFIMAIQVFVTVLEFKLVTLCGFVLMPFSFFHRTAFMAERVLGHVVSSGIKLLVLAVITGIGTTLFQQLILDSGLTNGMGLRTSMALVLAALSLLGLAMFGPSVANGIVAGGPQLGAGSAVTTALVGGGVGAAGIGLAGGAAMGLGAAGAGAARAGAHAAGAASSAYAAGAAGGGGAGAFGRGMLNVGRTAGKAAGNAATSPLRSSAESLKRSFRAGRDGSGTPNAGADAGVSTVSKTEAPEWAKALRQTREAARSTAHTLRGSDGHGSGAAVDLGEKKD